MRARMKIQYLINAFTSLSLRDDRECGAHDVPVLYKLMNIRFNLKNLLGGGNFEENTQRKIIDKVAEYLYNIRKLHTL